MTVYVLLGEMDYEGHTLLGVYASREEAEAAFEAHEEGRSCTFDRMVVQERVLGVAAEIQW
jgi:hypothetical protein